MQIAVISDIHDRKDRLEKVLSQITSCSINTIICLGDVATMDTLQLLLATNLDIFLTFGNAEREPDAMFQAQNEYKNLTVFNFLKTKNSKYELSSFMNFCLIPSF